MPTHLPDAVLNEPVADHVRSILDGHVVLSRSLAHRNIYPPIDILQSISRVMPDITSEEHYSLMRRFRELLTTYNSSEDLINIGAYAKGSNPKIDYAISKIDRILDYVRQGLFEKIEYEDALKTLKAIFED